MSAIGIDLDGVVFDWLGAIHTRVGHELGIDILRQVTEWYPSALRHFMDKYTNDPVFCESLVPLAGAVDGVMRLAEKFNKIYYVTGRPRRFRSNTRWSLSRWRLPEAPLIFPHGSKAVTAQRLGLTHFVDDRPQTVEELRIFGVDAYLMMVYQTPMRDRYARRPYLVTNWGQVLQQLDNVRDTFFCKYIKPFSLEEE